MFYLRLTTHVLLVSPKAIFNCSMPLLVLVSLFLWQYCPFCQISGCMYTVKHLLCDFCLYFPVIWETWIGYYLRKDLILAFSKVIVAAVLIENALFTCNSFLFVIQKDEITSCEERVKKLIELTPPKGKEFLHKIEHILEREKNWVSIFQHFLRMFSCK